MVIKFDRKLTKMGASYRITIPTEIVSSLGLGKGDILLIWVSDNQIIMEKKAV